MSTKEINPRIKRHDLSRDEVERQVTMLLGEMNDEALDALYEASVKGLATDDIIEGTVLNIVGGDVIIDIGYKSEGIVPLSQWKTPDEVDVGDKVEVLLEAVEDETGIVLLSKRKADRIRGWERVIKNHVKGDTVVGKVTRKIKGGLLVDIGVPVFLPASQIDIRRVPDISDWINRDIECKIIKIDESRMNIVVSRRKLLEEQREEKKQELLSTLNEGDIVEGVVKNLADFGAFIDLGGIDGLCHITDMSWGRIGHPSEVCKINDKITVKVLRVDPHAERISLGIKQLSKSPWENISDKYPVAGRFKGNVVNVLSYGAFVKLEEGVEGLVHISEMSWTKRINHPSEVVAIGDEVEVVVLDVNTQKQEISLGMKQVEVNPWSLVEQKYPPGTVVEGSVRNLTNYGAFVEIEEGIDGLLHVSDLSWTKKIAHPGEILKKGQNVRAVVLTVDQEKKRVALGIKQLDEDPWDRLIPEKFQVGEIVTGTVTKITNFGVFVQLENDLEGLLHISELSDNKIENPAEVVEPNDIVDVKVIKVDIEDRKIGLSLKRAIMEGAEPPRKGEGTIDLSTINQEVTPEDEEAVAAEAPVEEAEEVTPSDAE
ncbi:MAG: 30S ribosomal protein S1 [Planctomycetota bacterium]|nr:30S ribosomal protein S1 [Planctomycetota bacterium]